MCNGRTDHNNVAKDRKKPLEDEVKIVNSALCRGGSKTRELKNVVIELMLAQKVV